MTAAAILLFATTISSPGPWLTISNPGGWLPDSVSSTETFGSDDNTSNQVYRLSPTGHAATYSIIDGWEERQYYPLCKDTHTNRVVSSRRVLAFRDLVRTVDAFKRFCDGGFRSEAEGRTVFWASSARYPDESSAADYPMPDDYGFTPLGSSLFDGLTQRGRILQGLTPDPVYHTSRSSSDYGYIAPYILPIEHLGESGLESERFYYLCRQLDKSFTQLVDTNFAAGVSCAVTNLSRRIIRQPLAAISQALSVLDRTYVVGDVASLSNETHYYSSAYTITSSDQILVSLTWHDDHWESSPLDGSSFSFNSPQGHISHTVERGAEASPYADYLSVSDSPWTYRMVIHGGTSSTDYPLTTLGGWRYQDMLDTLAAEVVRTLAPTNEMRIHNPGIDEEAGQLLYVQLTGCGKTVDYPTGIYVWGVTAPVSAIGMCTGSYDAKIADNTFLIVPTLPPRDSDFTNGVVREARAYSSATLETGKGEGRYSKWQHSLGSRAVYSTNDVHALVSSRATDIRAALLTEQMEVSGVLWNLYDRMLPTGSDLASWIRSAGVDGSSGVVDPVMADTRIIFDDAWRILRIEQSEDGEWREIDPSLEDIRIDATVLVDGGTNDYEYVYYERGFDGHVRETIATRVDWLFRHLQREDDQ